MAATQREGCGEEGIRAIQNTQHVAMDTLAPLPRTANCDSTNLNKGQSQEDTKQFPSTIHTNIFTKHCSSLQAAAQKEAYKLALVVTMDSRSLLWPLATWLS